jgi:hypothetical protein
MLHLNSIKAIGITNTYLLREFLPLLEAHMPGFIRDEVWGPLPVPPTLSVLPCLINKIVLVFVLIVPENKNKRF